MTGKQGFLGSIDPGRTFEDAGAIASGPSTTPGGDAPTPFDALDGRRLAGPQGSHPLAGVTPADLLRTATDGLSGSIELSGPVRVGEGISGAIRIRATRAIKARGAAVRLVGVLLAEEARSGKSRAAEAAAAVDAANAAVRLASGTGTGGSASSSAANDSVSWVEVHGSVIEEHTFTDPVLPTLLAPGQLVEASFTIPAPRLGPPSAHAGVALVAWAIEARWDVAMGSDERIATLVPVAQHPDLLRSGAVTLPSGALFDVVEDEGARLSVEPLPPLAAGSQVSLGIAWSGAPGGRSARVELTTDVKARNALSVTSVSLPVEGGALGGSQVMVPLPPDLPPTLVTDGLSVGHRLRVIVDRPMRPDVSRERPVVVL